MSNWVPEDLRRLVRERAAGLCEYCLIDEQETHLGCEVDHVVSEKHGGQTVAENLAYACFYCNRHKGSDVASVEPQTGRLVRLFNPRTDAWGDHFQLQGGRIEWKTDVGEATARLLGFNLWDRILEREVLKSCGRFPSAAAQKRMH